MLRRNTKIIFKLLLQDTNFAYKTSWLRYNKFLQFLQSKFQVSSDLSCFSEFTNVLYTCETNAYRISYFCKTYTVYIYKFEVIEILFLGVVVVWVM